MNVTVNGKERQFEGEAEMPLLWFLRDELQLTGTKYGCGMGLCGACTVHIDGQAARSCVTPMSAIADKKNHNHRRTRRKRRSSFTKGLGVMQRPAVRILSIWSDHAGGVNAQIEAEADGSGHRRIDARQYLPVRHLSANP